jgi:hypothetical protein
MMLGVVEVDKEGLVAKAGCCALHQPGERLLYQQLLRVVSSQQKSADQTCVTPEQGLLYVIGAVGVKWNDAGRGGGG